MGRRVLLILLGGVIYLVLTSFGVPRRIAAMIGLVPFAILEAKGLISPYEPSASDILHGTDDTAGKDAGTK